MYMFCIFYGRPLFFLNSNFVKSLSNIVTLIHRSLILALHAVRTIQKLNDLVYQTLLRFCTGTLYLCFLETEG